MSFRVAPALNPPAAIRALVSENYGVPNMPMLVLKREDEIAAYEAEHTEVSPLLWDVVNHNMRLVRMWARSDETCVDLVVWCETSHSFRMAQDICFVDAYADAAAWRRAVYDLIEGSEEVWVVTHLE
jgi:hypothetical protein